MLGVIVLPLLHWQALRQPRHEIRDNASIGSEERPHDALQKVDGMQDTCSCGLYYDPPALSYVLGRDVRLAIVQQMGDLSWI